MTDKQPEALYLADWCEILARTVDAYDAQAYRNAAAELRRLHEENERLAGEVANRNRRALEGDEAVAALENVHAYYEKLERINAQLLEALEEMLVMWEDDPSYGSDTADKAYAAIKAAKGEV